LRARTQFGLIPLHRPCVHQRRIALRPLLQSVAAARPTGPEDSRICPCGSSTERRILVCRWNGRKRWLMLSRRRVASRSLLSTQRPVTTRGRRRMTIQNCTSGCWRRSAARSKPRQRSQCQQPTKPATKLTLERVSRTCSVISSRKCGELARTIATRPCDSH
jgi:hypothetical protein